MVLGLLNVGPLELLIIAAAAVMLFGGDLPDTARKAARMVVRLRALAADLGREFSNTTGSSRPFRTADELRRLAGLDDSPPPPTWTPAAPPPDATAAREPAASWRPRTLTPPAELTRRTAADGGPGAPADDPAVGAAPLLPSPPEHGPPAEAAATSQAAQPAQPGSEPTPGTTTDGTSDG